MVDKMFLMLPEFKVYTHNLLKAKKDYEAISKDEAVNKLIDTIFSSKGIDINIEETPKDFKEWFNEHKDEYKYERPKIVKTKYNHKKGIQDNSRQQRNNLLIDISRSILTNPDTVDKFVSPGSFDKIKRVAKISTIADNSTLLDQAKKVLSSKGIKGVSIEEALLNPEIFTEKDINNIVDNAELNPLDPLTFTYFHKLNMVGAALIGMYANNTTIFAKFLSYNNNEAKMGLTFDIKINGNLYLRLDGIKSSNGDIISKNCAEFSAASVDNVKDPVLATLLLNTTTAPLTSLMLRLGMSIEEIGLLFTLPTIKTMFLMASDLGSYSDAFSSMIELLTDTNDHVKSYYLNLMNSPENFEKDILHANFSSVDLLKNKTALDWEDEKFLRDLLRLVLLMDRLYQASQQLNMITKVARADSPNGAMAVTIAGNIIQKQLVENLETASRGLGWYINGVDIYNHKADPNMAKDQLRTVFMNSRFPILLAFYSLGIDFGQSLMNEYFIQYSPILLESVRDLTILSRKDVLDERDLNNYFMDFIRYQLSTLDIFGGGNSNDTREFYLSSYPARFMKLKQSHPELNKIGIIKYITLDERGNLLFKNSARLTPTMEDSFKREMLNLTYGTELEQQIASDLFIYSYFKEGLRFGPNSISKFFNTSFLNKVFGYTEALRNMTASNASDILNFEMQFLLNNLRGKILKSVPYKKDPITEKDPIRKVDFDKNELVLNLCPPILNYSDLTKNGKAKPRKYFSYGTKKLKYLAVLTDTDTDSATYKLIPEVNSDVSVLQNDGKGKVIHVGPKYIKGMQAEDMNAGKATNELVKAYFKAVEEVPADFIKGDEELTITVETVTSLPLYGTTTNMNKTNFC